jgi:hypothetical protein
MRKGKRSDAGQPHQIIAGLESALEEFGLEVTTPDAQFALGRLAGLQLASQLGLRAAHRAVSRERGALTRSCLDGLRERAATGSTERDSHSDEP